MLPRAFFPLLLAVAGWITPLAAQEPFDPPATLEWVKQQADKIDKRLHAAVLSQEHANLLLKLVETKGIFDLVALAGVYCHDVRSAAEMGRAQADLSNVNLQTDLNASLVRATQARIFAIRMRDAATQCLKANSDYPETPVNALADVFDQDIQLARTDIENALASRDFHVLAVKLKHAVNVLHDAELLAANLEGCDEARQAAADAIQACTDAMLSSTWEVSAENSKKALQFIEKLKEAANCRFRP